MGLLMALPILKEIIGIAVPDPNKKMELTLQLAQLEAQAAAQESQERMAQMNVNNTEAASGNMFTAGWRPAVGWICALGVGYSFILQPLASWIAVLAGFKGTFPDVGTSDLMVLLTGMLGLSASRTYEKKIGVADSTAVAQPSQPAPVKPKKKVLGIDWPF